MQRIDARRSSRRRLIAIRGWKVLRWTRCSTDFVQLADFSSFVESLGATLLRRVPRRKIPRELLRRCEWNPPFENCFLIGKEADESDVCASLRVYGRKNITFHQSENFSKIFLDGTRRLKIDDHEDRLTTDARSIILTRLSLLTIVLQTCRQKHPSWHTLPVITM